MALQQLQDIYVRHTSVAGLRPASADVQAGELMTNTADQELYVGTGSGSYFTITAGGGGGGGALTNAALTTLLTTPPTTPILGQLYVDVTPAPTAPPMLKVWTGTGWMTIGAVDGTTLVRDQATGVMSADTLDMGVIP